MNRNLLTTAALVLVGVSLSACNLFGSNKSSVAVVTPPAPAAAKFEDQFGSASTFGATFGASPNSEPRDANAGDVIPVNPTAEPVSLPG